MLAWLSELAAWHWIVLGSFVLLLELFITSGFFIGIAVGAYAAAALMWLMPVNWQTQLLVFALVSALASVGYWKIFRRFNNKTTAPLLNHRLAQYVGRKVQTAEPLLNGSGFLQIGDTRWPVVFEGADITAGVTVEITGVEDDVLKITVC